MNQAPVDRLSAELVVYAARLVRAVSRRASQDVPAAALRLLSLVDELGPVTIGRLAEADRCSQPTMSAAVQNLVDKDWASKHPNPADARSSLIDLTGEGRGVLAAARHRNAAVVAERLRADPHHDQQDLATAVAVLKGLLENEPREGST